MLIIGVALAFVIAVADRWQASAAVSSTLNFQARLLTASGSLVADGNYNVEFKIYNAASSSGSSQGSCSGDAACLWTETRIALAKVRVLNGYMTVNLGSETAFSTTINWDQELWLSMNIGGTGSPGWDGEMAPRLKLSAVPYAFKANQLANTNGANRSTLEWATQTTSNAILLPNEAGTVCIQSSVACGFLTGSTADYIQNQNSSSQTANFRINGTGRADVALQAPLFDTVSAGALALGTTNATAINLQQNTTIASGKTLTIQGNTLVQPASDGIVFNIKSSFSNNQFTIDTANGRVGVALGASNSPTLQGTGLEIKGALRFSGVENITPDLYVTPKVGGGSVGTLINIVNYNPGAFAQLVAMGLPSNADASSRALSLFDARASAHQPTLAIFSPDQNQVGGFSWDGSDTTFFTKSSSNNMSLQANGLDILTLQNVSSVARVGIGNSSPSYPLDVTGDINSSTALRVGGTVVCTSSGCTSSSGSGSYIQNQSASTQTANFKIQGSGISTNTATIVGVLNQDNDLFQLQSSGGTPVAGIRPSGAIYSAAVTDPITDVPANARLFVQPVSNASTAIIARAASGGAPTGDIMQLQTANGATNVFTVGVAGATTVNNSSTAALLVQNTSSVAALVVDTSNSRVGIGAAPSRTLHAVVNNTQTTAPMSLLEQTSTGDITLEFKTPSKSYIVGQDASDAGKFKISSSTASSSPTTLGKTTIGGSEDTGDNNFMECTKFVTSGAGTAASFTVYARGAVEPANNLFQGAIYNDNGSGTSPTTLLASSASSTLTANAWNTVSISATLTASTTYWLCANTNSTDINLNNWAYDTVSNSAVWKAQTFGTWPSSFGAGSTASTQFSFYVTYTPSGTYDSFTKSLMSLSETGQSIFQNSSDSTSAFQIQNAAGNSMFSVDSTNQRVYIGPTAGDTVGTILVLGNKTNTGDPTGVEGAMYYNSASKTFRCYAGGAWHSCLGGLLSVNSAASSSINTCTTACPAFSTSAAIPANYCQPGRVIRVVANGTYSNASATVATLAFGVYYGTDATVRGNNTLIGATSGALTPVTTGMTNVGWSVDFYITCFSTTSMNGQGFASITTNNTAGSVASGIARMYSSTNTTVTSTSNKNLYIFPTWGTSNGANTILVQQLIVTAM